jgi:hypothetical protein
MSLDESIMFPNERIRTWLNNRADAPKTSDNLVPTSDHLPLNESAEDATQSLDTEVDT